MKRAIVALALLAAPASARIMVMEPPLVSACAHPASLTELTSCLQKRQLTAKPLGALPGFTGQRDGARLFAIFTQEPHPEVQSIALYLEDKKGHWNIGGLQELDGTRGDIAVTRFEKIGTAQHHGYRFDVATRQPSSFLPDDVTSMPAVTREAHVSLCAGDAYNCTTVTESCQQFVAGQLYMGWSGALEIAGESVTLTGVGTSLTTCGRAGAWTLAQLGFHN